MVVEVLISRQTQVMNQTFDYHVPLEYENLIQVGVRVFIPIGNSKEIGYILGIKTESNFKLKDIIEVIDIEPIISEKDILLAKFIQKHYFTSFSSALELMIPSFLKKNISKELILKDRDRLSSVLVPFFEKNKVRYTSNMQKYQNIIKDMAKNDIIEIKHIIKDNGSIKKTKYLKFLNDYLGKSENARVLSNYLKNLDKDIPKEEVISQGFALSSISTLIKNNSILEYETETYREVDILDENYTDVVLNEEQTKIVNEIKDNLDWNSKYLIHGVCGSGKTEIYLNLIKEVLKSGKEALMLVPEISLTPQIASRFKHRFKDKIALIHSNLSNGQRYDEYRRIKRGEARVVVGVRSALFSPFKNLGIIIIDECQEESYIQDSTPFYDAHFVASYLTKFYNCPLVLGSATPRVSTYYKALNNEYKLLNLTQRVNKKKMEDSIIVDMRNELKNYNKSVFSRVLQKELINNFNKQEQSILFINRRGYSVSYSCRSCGEVIKCPNCAIPLTYHKTVNKLKCHYCNYEIVAPSKCPNCGSSWIKALGSGTEKIEEEIKKLLPLARVLRIDSDTTSNKDSYNNYISQINNHECDIILGTQIVAKGLDFPLVSLVGVINADLNLNMPVYNAYEKTYDLLEQVSGRAGRKDTEGKTIIQTYNPSCYAIRLASKHNYLEFYKEEIALRKSANNPPFYNLFEIMIISRDKKEAFQNALNIKKMILEKETLYILGPVTDRIFMLNNEYRYVLTIKSKNEELEVLNLVSSNYLNNSKVKVYIKRM